MVFLLMFSMATVTDLISCLFIDNEDCCYCSFIVLCFWLQFVQRRPERRQHRHGNGGGVGGREPGPQPAADGPEGTEPSTHPSTNHPTPSCLSLQVTGGVLACRRWLRGRSLYFSRLLTSRARSRYFFLFYLFFLHVLVFMCLTSAL